MRAEDSSEASASTEDLMSAVINCDDHFTTSSVRRTEFAEKLFAFLSTFFFLKGDGKNYVPYRSS
jgi:hypothetical protein